MKINIKLSLVTILLLSQSINAVTQDQNDWAHILSGVQDSQTGQIGFLYDTNEQRSGTLYNSSVTYQFQNADANGDFGASESVNMTITMPSGELIDTGGFLNADELSAWADANANALLKAVFGSDPSSTIVASTTSVAEVSNEIVQYANITRQRTRPKTIKESVIKTKEDNNKNKESEKVIYDSTFTSLVMMDSEKASTRSNGVGASSSAFRFAYDKELSSGNDIGAFFSYRKNKANDVYDSKATNYLLSPYYKYYHTLNDDVEVIGIANLVLGLKSMDSSLFKNFSYFEYGLGISAIPSYYLNDKVSFSIPFGIQTLKKRISSGVPESIDFIVDAINNLGYQTSFNYGLGAEYAFRNNWYFNADILQTRELGSDTSYERDVVTYLNLRTSYYGELFNYSLGYKTVQNIKNYSENAYMVSVQYNW